MNILLYATILLLKIVEVSIGTVRIVLITRGERVYGALLGFVEVILWILLVSTVLKDITNDPLKIFIYAIGFALGNYVGSFFEQKIGVGNVRIETIVMNDHGELLADGLRSNGYAVTVIEGQGKDHLRQVLLMNVNRREYMKVIDMIKSFQENVVITINDIKPIYGGYGNIKK